MVFFTWAGVAGTGMSKPFYEREFPSTVAEASDALADSLKVLAARGWINPSNDFSPRLCLEEALVNAVVHGNANEASRRVRVQFVEQGDTCIVRVFDEGKGFDVDKIQMADCATLGGRGVCLIREFMEDVRFNRKDKCLEMVFNRNTFSEACA